VRGVGEASVAPCTTEAPAWMVALALALALALAGPPWWPVTHKATTLLSTDALCWWLRQATKGCKAGAAGAAGGIAGEAAAAGERWCCLCWFGGGEDG
jgi:hypothetical protein